MECRLCLSAQGYTCTVNLWVRLTKAKQRIMERCLNYHYLVLYVYQWTEAGQEGMLMWVWNVYMRLEVQFTLCTTHTVNNIGRRRDMYKYIIQCLYK
jgi:hypothetical protein